MITSDRLAIGLVFVALAVLACFSPAQGDTWWHLRAGMDIWRTHTVGLTDTYSYTATGQTFPDHGWLSEVYFAGLYRLGGIRLVAAGTAAPILMAWLIAARLSDGPFEARLVTLVGGAAASTVSWAIRPQVLSMLALAVTCQLLVQGRRRWLPIVFLVWANAHGAVLLGLVAVGSVLVVTTLRERRLSAEFAGIAALCALTTLSTPLGLRLWPEVIASLERSKADALIEWSMPGFAPVYWPFWALGGALLILALKERRAMLPDAVVLTTIAVALLPLAVRSVRNVAMFTLVAAPAVTQLLRSRQGERRARPGPHRERTAINVVILAVAGCVGAGVVALAWVARAPMLGWDPLTAQAIAAIRECPDPIYNTFENGGALIWFVPERKVFIDNRQDPYPDELLNNAHRLEFDGRYTDLFAHFGIRCAIVPSASQTAAALNRDNAWSHTYTDQHWAVFTR